MTICRVPVLVVAVFGLVLTSGRAQETVPGALAGTRMALLVEDGRVTASLVRAPLLSVLEQLSSRTRIAIVPGSGLEAAEVSAELKSVPVEQALRSLLQQFDAFFFYTPAGGRQVASLAAVWVYPRGGAATIRPVPLETWGTSADLELALNDRDETVREQAYEALMNRPDRASRNRVILAIRGATETDADLRQRLLSAAQTRGLELPRDVLMDLVRADGSDAIRVMALDALAGDEAARETAVAASNDPSDVVRERAREFVAELDEVARSRSSRRQ